MLGSYAAIIIPMEVNIQESLSDVYSVVMNLVERGYEVYYSLRPFTVKVYELKSNLRPYIRTFGINTFIVKVYDKEDFIEVSEHFSEKVRANFTFDRIWVKGRRIIDTKVCTEKCLGTPVYEFLEKSGFKISCGNAETYVQCYNELGYLFSRDKLILDNIAEKEAILNEIQILKPWHTVIYGAKPYEISDKLIGQRRKILIYESMFAEELIVALSDHGKVSLVLVSEKPLTVCFNNVFEKHSLSSFRTIINSALFTLSYEVNVSV